MRSICAAALLASLAAGCGTVQVGKDYDLTAFSTRVQRGVTTRTDVRLWLGAPSSEGVSVETSGVRYELWTYYRGTGSLPAMSDAHLKMLQVKFDAQGLVQGYEWSGESR
jgi:outer membrane protein assembly factor BamE (lipoprotein component of BamABCDE complex)